MFRLPVLSMLAAAGLMLAATASAQPVVVPPSKLAMYWILSNKTVDAMVPNYGVNLDKPGCASVTYTIGADGVTRNIQVRKVVPAGDLGKVAASVIQNFRYTASSRNPDETPVYTYYVVPFNLPADKASRQRIVAACKLSGFGG